MSHSNRIILGMAALGVLAGCTGTNVAAPEVTAQDVAASEQAPAQDLAWQSSPEPEPELTPQQQAQKQLIEAEMAKARGNFERKNYPNASQRLQLIVKRDPENYEARMLLGETFLRMGRVDDAMKQFTSSTASTEFRPQALQGIGMALLKLNDKIGAAENLRKAVELDPGLWRAHNALGWIYDDLQEYDAAERNYRAALSVVPNSPTVHNNLGMSYLTQRRYEEAVVEFRAALATDPGLKTARSNLRIALASQGKYVEALAGVPKTALPDALNDVGYMAMMRGDYDSAEAYLSRAMDVSPSYHVAAARNLESLEALRLTNSQ